MIGLPANTQVWFAAGHTDMRKGFNGLAALVQTALHGKPCCGHFFGFRGRRGNILKVLWYDGQGLMLPAHVLNSKFADHILGIAKARSAPGKVWSWSVQPWPAWSAAARRCCSL